MTIADTLDQIAHITKADYQAKSQVHNLLITLAREIATKALQRYREIQNHPIAVADPNDRPSDEARMMSHTKMILKRLIEFGPQTNLQLSRLSLRVTARIHDLRHMLRHTKWTVKSEHISGGTWMYSLIRRESSCG